jgi:hypothetical protein
MTSISPAILLLTAVLAGCAQSISTPLPDLNRPEADGMLMPAQQKKAIEELAQKRAEAEAQAIKQIEQTR